MKILTWNVYRHNRQIVSLYNYIQSYRPDIICLQEINAADIPLLEKYFSTYKCYKTKQFFIKKNSAKSIELYNVTLSDLVVSNCESVEHDNEGLVFPPRYRYSYSRLDLSFSYIDVLDKDNNSFRIFNTHFECVAPPSLRLKRLKQIKSHFCKDKFNIIAGDFNTFCNPLVALVTAPIYGNYKLRDFLTFERKEFTSEFEQMELVNFFYGVNTFKYAPGQYDYILAPINLEVRDFNVINPSNSGSDHYGLLMNYGGCIGE